MIKRRIAYKLFLLHVVLFAAIFMIQIVFQSLYLEPFYVHTKKQNMKNIANEIESKIKNHEQPASIDQYIAQQSEKNITIVSVIDLNMQHRYGSPLINNFSYFVISTKDNKEYKIINDFILNDSKRMDEESVTIEGYLLDDKESLVIPNTIRVGNQVIQPNVTTPFSFTLRFSQDQGIMEPKPITIEGNIVSTQTENHSLSAQKTVLIKEMFDFFNKNPKQPIPNQINTVRDAQTGINNLVLIENIDGTDLILLAVTSLQPVDEVIGNLNQYYIILFVFTMIIVTVIAFVYSKTLSKPLIKMSAIANQIANQNFSSKYIVKSNDELGQMGEALNKISTNLEQKIAELVHTNEKLAQDYDMQMKLKAKEKEFVTNISHELKTPLTVINGYVKGIKSGVYTANALKYYDIILQEVERMTEMIQEMLDISKLESPTYQLVESTFDLWHTFLKVYDIFKAMAEDKGLKVHFEIEDEAYVRGDARRVEQVITNLFTNAVKYTPKQSHIYINITYNDIAKKYTFKIKNENAYISDEDIERIWDPFYRIEKSRNKEFGGTGLGLAIVKQILDLHHSNYGVNTQKGVEFYFDLPAVHLDDIDA